MNRWIIASTLLAAAALICVVAVISTCMVAKDMEKSTNEIINATSDGSYPTEEQIDEFCKKWDKYSKLVSVYTRHEAVEGVTESVEVLPDVAKEKNEMLLRLTCSKILASVEHLKETELPSIQNIM